MRHQWLSGVEVQRALAAHLRRLREQAGLSRQALAERSAVPAPTLKKFEATGQISLRQLLLLWQSLDDLGRLHRLTQADSAPGALPRTIEEVLAGTQEPAGRRR